MDDPYNLYAAGRPLSRWVKIGVGTSDRVLRHASAGLTIKAVRTGPRREVLAAERRLKTEHYKGRTAADLPPDKRAAVLARMGPCAGAGTEVVKLYPWELTPPLKRVCPNSVDSTAPHREAARAAAARRRAGATRRTATAGATA